MANVRLIDANAALALIKQLRNKDINNHTRLYACNFAMSILGNPEQTPTVNPEDCRAQGRWKEGVCTICGFTLGELTDGENDLEQWVWDEGFDYCPNCGARMNGKERDE